MTKTKIQDILREYEDVLVKIGATPEKEPRNIHSLNHVLWMVVHTMRAVGDILEQKMSPEKVQRWLGFIQGALWANGVYSIDEMRVQTSETKPPEIGSTWQSSLRQKDGDYVKVNSFESECVFYSVMSCTGIVKGSGILGLRTFNERMSPYCPDLEQKTP